MNDDTVSRAAVMQSLTREYNRRRTGDGLKLAWIEKAVNEVPAVQPKDPENGSASCINPEKMHDRTTDDCISRQAVLKAIDDYERENVQWLPAVQTCEDAVSRQQAIDALMVRDKELRNINWYDKPYAEGECRGIDEALAIVSNLPSVQPQRKTDEFCHDCKEYDQEKHCCPRFNQVIRQTLSEQPEIIRCKDCRYQDKGLNESESWNLCGYRPWLHVPTEDEHYCGYAERRTDSNGRD